MVVCEVHLSTILYIFAVTLISNRVPREITLGVTVFEEEESCIVCLEMRADELMRRLISGELTNYSVVRTSPEPLH
jgi:hypothetical protein